MRAFAHLVHADWSVRPEGRWMAEAVRAEGGWRADAPRPVGDLPGFVAYLTQTATSAPTLAGFDVPIGLPVAFGGRTDFDGFLDALEGFGTGAWKRFYDVAATPAEISPRRPFYPLRAGGTLRRHLLDGHGIASLDALMRRCERGAPGRKTAGCLFWTLGASQAGRAALTGWREVIRPALANGAALWPFHGDLATLADRGGLALAETYPADVYARLGAAFRAGESKRRQADRAGKAEALLAWARAAGVTLADPLRRAIQDGFGPEDKGGDRFDAVVGLFGMIDVVEGRRPEGAPPDDDIRRWEGWILGRSA